MGPAWRPTHLLAFAHACIENLIYRGFSHRRRNRFPAAIALPIVDGRPFIAFQVGKKFAQTIVELLQTLRELWRFSDDDAAQCQNLVHPLLSFLRVCMPEAP